MRRTAALLGTKIPLCSLLGWGLKSLEQKGQGFAVPTPLVTSRVGRALLVNCPLSGLNRFLADWISDRGHRLVHTSDYFLGAGDWAPVSGMIMESPIARETVELAAVDLDFRSTDSYAKMVRAAEKGHPIRRQQVLLNSIELIDEYFVRFVTLFKSIREHGLIPYHRLQDKGLGEPGERNVGIAIGPGGELYRLPGGQHRTAITKVLALATIPAEVRLIHIAWLRKITKETGISPAHAILRGIEDSFISFTRMQ